MALTELDHESAEQARRLRAEVTQRLQEPLAEVVRTLQRLALAQVGPEAPVLDAQLLVRANSLAHALELVISDIVASGTHRGSLDGREPQSTVVVREALEATVGRCGSGLRARSIVVRASGSVAINTIVERFEELLCVTLRSVEPIAGEVRIVVERSRGELLLGFERCHLVPPGLDEVRALARALGGTADVVATGDAPKVVVWLPQQRQADAALADLR